MDFCKLDNFRRFFRNKSAKIVKFSKIPNPGKILTKDGRRATVLKLVDPPNLLKQENVCLIPREGGTPEY